MAAPSSSQVRQINKEGVGRDGSREATEFIIYAVAVVAFRSFEERR